MLSTTAFILAMTQHPEIYQKAREEMARVTGNARLPDFEDRPSLPYLECIMKEVFRYDASLYHYTCVFSLNGNVDGAPQHL